jgi:pimeloyl-ACP methyl ester carboxylesterase
MRRDYVKTGMGQIHYQVQGDGETILLLHQTGISSEEYAAVGPLLAARYHVVAPDIPGHGSSDAPPAGFSIEQHAGAIVEFMDAVGITRCHLVGHHVGSRLAAEIAASYPARVNRLILSGCPYYTQPERAALRDDPKYQHPVITADTTFVDDLWRNYAARWGKGQAPPELLCKLVAITMESLSRGFDIHDVIFAHDIEPKLAKIKSPTLVLSGSQDVFYPKLTATAAVIPGARAQVIDGAGYFITLEQPEAFARVVEDFVAEK